MIKFILGAVAGGIALWYWGDQVREIAESKSKRVRKGAAETLQAVESRAEDVLDQTKKQVSSVLQAGQDVIRPTPRGR